MASSGVTIRENNHFEMPFDHKITYRVAVAIRLPPVGHEARISTALFLVSAANPTAWMADV